MKKTEKSLKQRESFHHKTVFENNQTNNFHILVCHLNELIKNHRKKRSQRQNLSHAFKLSYNFIECYERIKVVSKDEQSVSFGMTYMDELMVLHPSIS